MTTEIRVGHVLDRLREMDSDSVQGCATSPPYYQLRAYGTAPQTWGGDPDHDHDWAAAAVFSASSQRSAGRGGLGVQNRERWHHSDSCACGAWRGELGQEPTPALFTAHLAAVFREVRRVLKPDGVLLLNIGDSYCGSGKGPSNSIQRDASQIGPSAAKKRNPAQFANGQAPTVWSPIPPGMKAKDLLMIPARLAIALCDDGWYLRGEYVWSKPACMPESVRDRCTRSHEMIYHLTKSPRYYWGQDELREPLQESTVARLSQNDGHPVWNGERQRDYPGPAQTMDVRRMGPEQGANRRSVWRISPGGFTDAHFATMPADLAELMVKAISRPGDTVLDPFCGAGTTLLAADRLGRNGLGLELNPAYAEMARRRIAQDAPLFAGVAVESRTPLVDKQAASGLRTYAGFNERWDAKERAGRLMRRARPGAVGEMTA